MLIHFENNSIMVFSRLTNFFLLSFSTLLYTNTRNFILSEEFASAQRRYVIIESEKSRYESYYRNLKDEQHAFLVFVDIEDVSDGLLLLILKLM